MKPLAYLLASFLLIITTYACQKKDNANKSLSFIEKIEQVEDSVQVGKITIRNLFKSQILAHKENRFDSIMIVKKVYEPHQSLWDNCYGMIFGEENASKFNTKLGMVKWNKNLYPKNKAFFNQRAQELIEINIDSVLESNLHKFNQMVPYEVEAKISIIFTPITGIIFGGCDNDQFCIELNYKDMEIKHLIEQGIPHELNHLAYEPLRENDPHKNTALRQTIDEGFACYFTWQFFDKQIPKYTTLENISSEDWNWFLKNEKEIFMQTKAYFYDESGDNPLLNNNKHQLFKDAPSSLNYWMGFRIVEKYVEKYGISSWKDIYKLDVLEVLNKSEYEAYINQL
ncbi:DUF2268 domain-containing putative Zn-dependent protease [Aureibacter tunicatorum]|uniref:SprT family Zn-dependent metalloprotease n=1 Tax=Aureibacter tunicatorum TaxID=866807 RepID=A0AAE4BU89_9BACT|nr:DUF2268 domain-containing putative Zn-dependent protease [Aureibacter tunicatorum]MDR6240462.1 putative SprT family Zn-dependent metalloprotease [Aureibacter tunicatorum]BDD05659.1 hypothetical protein AUTU_31420 [Aureibacter tunicatorum]